MHERLTKNEFAANVIKLISGTALGQLITVFISPLLTRIYAPEDFGLFAVYFSIVSILSVIICLRYEIAIVLPKDEDKAIDLVLLSGFVALGLSFLLLFIGFVFNNQLVHIIGYPEFKFYIFLIPLSTFFYGCFQIFNFWMTRLQLYNKLAISKTLKGISTGVMQLGWGFFLYPGAIGLILGQIAGNMLPTFYLFQHSFHQVKKRLINGFTSNLKSALIEYKRFPIFTSWATLINALSQNIPALLLAFLFSPAAAGFYAITIRVISMPAALIGNSVRQVYFQRASAIHNTGSSIYPLFKKTTWQLVFLAIIPFTVIIIWGSSLFTFVLGPSWGEAGTYASILSLWLFFTFINPPSVMSLFILKLNKTHLIYEILLLIFRSLALITGFLVYDDVLMSLGLYTVVGIIFNLILIGVVHFSLTKR